jgi:hypothetical protein
MLLSIVAEDAAFLGLFSWVAKSRTASSRQEIHVRDVVLYLVYYLDNIFRCILVHRVGVKLNPQLNHLTNPYFFLPYNAIQTAWPVNFISAHIP